MSVGVSLGFHFIDGTRSDWESVTIRQAVITPPPMNFEGQDVLAQWLGHVEEVILGYLQFKPSSAPR